MINFAHARPRLVRPCPKIRMSSKSLYHSLATGAPADVERTAARDYLADQIRAARNLACDLPLAADELIGWMESHTAAVGLAYRQYLAERKSGMPRHFFTNKSHALFFLKTVAPTKLADGSWLYGLLEQWDDPRYHDLIRTYLEELGDGVSGKNHVVLYESLLAANDCDQWDGLGDTHFVQGAIQLGLAYNAAHFLPEIIGYNLGYEQLPLHLLVTAYELNELGIDPYYFTLHVTVDNAGTGHARKAVHSLRKLMPRLDDGGEFYRRVMDGYRLNELGANTSSVIASFDLQAELVTILQAKSTVGMNMHSDYCRVAGRSVNDWLSNADEIGDFLQALQTAGWIKRGEPVENSRFWHLIQGDRAEMFGVFSEYEQQILRDWITSPAVASLPQPTGARVLSFRARQRSAQVGVRAEAGTPPAESRRGLLRHHLGDGAAGRDRQFNPELRALEQRLAAVGSKHDMMQALIKLMSPALHHSAAGLMATRMFTRLFR